MPAAPRSNARIRTAACATLGAIVAGSILGIGPAVSATRTVSAATLLADLPVRAEQGSGYASAKFGGWTDADSDGCDTREEVLAAEAIGGARKGCRLTGWSWRSPYDGSVRTKAKDVVVEGLVPRSEAWQSGASEWTSATRNAFTNDLASAPTLLAASRSSSKARAAREPSAWLPGKAYRCTYVSRWVAVKWRWSLSVDKAEKAALTKALKACGSTRVTQPSRAKVSLVPKPKPTPPPPNDKRYDSCKDATATGLGPYVRDRDPEYAWYRDDDADGTTCEAEEAFQVHPSTERGTTRFVATSGPQIRLEVSNPNPSGGHSYAHARVLDGGVEIWRGTSAPGSTAPHMAAVSIEDGVLADARTYVVQAWGSPYSTSDTVPDTALSMTITTDMTAPPPPTVTGSAPFTVSSSATDVVAYWYGINVDVPVHRVPTTNGAAKQINACCGDSGPSWVSWWAEDAAGNRSARVQMFI
jgi:hypothetical protein